ncbi:MAG: hypothetical protein WD579_03500 [Candidatus Paceibacterota bacterium]
MDNELKKRIEQYKEFKWERLLRKDLGRHSLEEVKESFDNVKMYLDTVVEYKKFRELPEQYLQILHSRLNEFFEFEEQLSNQFQNVSERPQWIKKVKQFEYGTWDALRPIIEYIRFTYVSGDSSTKLFDEKIKQLEGLGESLSQKLQKATEFEQRVERSLNEVSEKSKRITAIADQVAQDEEKYTKAKEVAENWIKTEGKATASTLQDKSKIFSDKADKEHVGRRVWLWLAGVLVFAAGAIFSAILLIWKLNGDSEGLTIGAALLRISVVGMFFSLAYLCYQQFGIQRRLYEIYKFKAIALSTMENLIKSFTDPGDRQLIVEKAIEIVFTEPSFKEDKVAHQRVIDELVDVLKKKI